MNVRRMPMSNLNDIFFTPAANQELTYDQVLEDVQRYFAENHASTIAEAGEGNAERATSLLKELMEHYIVKRKYALDGLSTKELCYRRMMTLAKRKYNMDDSILMQIMVEAYPIIVFTKQLEDRSRKIMEIIEGEDYQDGRLIAHSLYKYEVEDNVTDDRGETRVVGHHKKIGLISDSLKKRLLDNGISNKELEEFMQPPKEVG